MNATPPPFDLLGPLPSGTTVLEASAGTGKTYTIAGLVARYVAEGVAEIDELLVVTFGRAATQELRDRVRERLVACRDGLCDPGAARHGSDDVVRYLADAADAADDEVRRRGERLAIALASFDSATVATMHEFCQRVLVTLGVSADVDADARLVERFDDLVDDVVDDLYLRKWAASGHPSMTLDSARALARTVIADGQAALVPEPHPDDEAIAAVRWRFAQKIRDEVELRKRHAQALGFDDWLTRLRHTLDDERTGPSAKARLRERYRIVLVDEFQDTDPVQWDILRLAFHGATTLVLIGDPKQAIYAFRGADVHAYLAATETADHVATLAHNWRSDPELLRGLDGIFRGASLGDPRITVHPVIAAHHGRSLDLDGPPVRIRVLGRGDEAKLSADTARRLAVADVVGEAVDLLDRGPMLRPRDGSAPRELRAGDIAVVVRTNRQLDDVHAALSAAGVASVQRSNRSVFRTPAAGDWLVLLDALEQPHRRARVRRLAVSTFVGWDAARLDAGDGRIDALALRVRHWVRIFGERGVAALFETVSRDERLATRLLGQTDGERRYTDLRHVAETLHAQAMSGALGLTALLEWLRRRVREAVDDASVERSRRLDSDDEAVQLVTTWASKGLEFPVVLVPFEWDRHLADRDIPLCHEPGTSAGELRRIRNVGGPTTPTFAADQRRDRAEQLGEDLRLLYVAATRAQSRLTLWWVPSDRNTPPAPLHRLLFTSDPAVDVPERVPVPSDPKALATISALALDGALGVESGSTRPAARRTSARDVPSDLVAAHFGRGVDTAWRRSSYSALTAGVHAAAPMISSEPDDIETLDEAGDAPAQLSTEYDVQSLDGDESRDAARTTEQGRVADLRRFPSAMDALPGGAAFGTLVHAVLEHLDPSVDLDSELAAHCATQLDRFGPAGLGAEALAAGLRPALLTPLGPLADGRRLVDIPAADRLVELEFELPLGGGDVPVRASRVSALAEVLRTHLPADDPLAGYADQLADPVLGDTLLEGYLTGSIDAVLRIGHRYVIVDYKTNRLGTNRPGTNRLGVAGEPLTAWDYRAAALAPAMLHAHYPLQALLYSVALHRYLRWRLAGYDPELHLGGALYLFLRGMVGPRDDRADGDQPDGDLPDSNAPHGEVPGVFAWRPSGALVIAASDVLAGGSDA